MFGGIILKIRPQFVRESILVTYIGFKNISYYRNFFRHGQIEIKFNIFAISLRVKSNNHNTLSVLRDIGFSVQNAEKYFIVQLVKRFMNHLERAAFIMAAQIFYIFKHKGLWPFCLQNSAHIKKQSSLRFVLKTCRPTQTLFLGYTRDRKRLTGETCYKNIMVRYIGSIYFGNVTIWLFPKIGEVSFLAVFIPFVRIHTVAASAFKCNTHTTNAGK